MRAVDTNVLVRLLTRDEPTQPAVAAALETYRRRPGLGSSDCLLVELARKAGDLPLGTFDRDLSKLDGATRL
jgi:predicted nucleic acid-binding protein